MKVVSKMDIIPYSKPVIPEGVIDLIKDVFDSGYVSQGKYLEIAEKKIAEFVGAKYAICLSSASAGLHLSSIALGITNSNYVATSPITFVSTISGAMHLGAEPVLVDIDPKSYNMDMDQLRKILSAKKIKAVFPVSFAGQSFDVEALQELKKEFGFSIVADHSHSLGGSYKFGNQWYKNGCGTHADVEIFSFQAVKHITSGEGGAITTNNEELYKKILQLRSHSIDKSETIHGWEYDVLGLGYNYRISEMQCAMLLPQMEELDKRIEEKQKIADWYKEQLQEITDVSLPETSKEATHSYHLYVIRTPKRDQLYKELREAGYGVQIHYIPLYKHTLFKNFTNYKKRNFPESEKYYDETLSLPLYPGIGKDQIIKISEIIKKVHE